MPPDRRWPPSTVVTGVDGGYDVDVREMAARGAHVLGRVVAMSDGAATFARNATEILDEADASFAGFITAAREFAAANPDLHLDDEERPRTRSRRTAIAEIDAVELRGDNVVAVVWATGYNYDYGWLHAPVLDDKGRPLQQRGVSPVPGLYFLGLHWMHTFKSGLFSGVGSDAEYIADHMSATRTSEAGSRPVIRRDAGGTG